MGSFPTELFDRKGPIARYWAIVCLDAVRACVLSAWVALSLWAISPVMHGVPFSLFVAAVVVTARFAGFGPALLCTGSRLYCSIISCFSRHTGFRTLPSTSTPGGFSAEFPSWLEPGAPAHARDPPSRADAAGNGRDRGMFRGCNLQRTVGRNYHQLEPGSRNALPIFCRRAVGRHVTITAPPGRVGEVEKIAAA